MLNVPAHMLVKTASFVAKASAQFSQWNNAHIGLAGYNEKLEVKVMYRIDKTLSYLAGKPVCHLPVAYCQARR